MRSIFFTIAILTLLSFASIINAQQLPVVIQAEDGARGSAFRITDTLGARCVTVKTESLNSFYPGNANRVVTFTVTFPDTGMYDLYARILTGPGNYDDDSYFYARGFGVKNVTLNTDWVRANNLASVGFNSTLNVVSGLGSAGSGIWKWLNFSKTTGEGSGTSFRVDSGALTQTFQIGGRETGLYIDKLVFAQSGLYFTVANLNRGEAGSDVPPGDEPTGTPIAAGKTKFLGSEWDYGQSAYFSSYWNQITPGNAGKWGSVESTRDVMNWSVLDSTYNVAHRYHFPFKEHTLIWGAQQPAWIGALDSAAQREEIIEWYAALANRYDSIEYIDVVNEPLHNAPNGMLPWGSSVPNVNYAKALGGAGATGYDWIINSFRLARQYFPDSKLILNEYSVINSTPTTQQFIEVINLLKAENLIDGIGEQGHAFTTYGTSLTLMQNNLDLLAATGIPIYITELDVDGQTDLKQLQEYQRIFPMFWEHPGIAGITLWGYRFGVWRQNEGAYLINNDDTERPALKWMKAYVNDTLTLTDSISVVSQDQVDSVFTGEKLQMQALVFPSNTTIPDVTWSVAPANKATIDQSGLLTTTGEGIVTITATAWDGSGKNGSMQITIANRLVESITLSSSGGKDSIFTGETLQINALVQPANAYNRSVTWSVLPAELATINTNGLLTALNDGMVTVVAVAKDGSGISDTVEIIIMNRLVSSIILSTPNNVDSVLVNASLQISAAVLPLNATDKSFTWSLDPAGLADISANGMLTPLTAGEVRIVAMANDGSEASDTLKIVIVDVPDAAGLPTSDNFRIYPNPSVGGHFSISGMDGIKTIDILDLNGKKVAGYKTDNRSSMDFTLQPGVYIIRLSNGRNHEMKKITVK